MYLPSIFALPLICDILKLGLDIVVLTEPEIGPSWADFPLTLKLECGQRLALSSLGGALHNAVWCLGLDLEIGRGSVVEVFGEELDLVLEHFVPRLGYAVLTSLAGLAISLKGTGIPDMMAVEDGVGRR